MAVQRMDHVGVIVDDLAAAIAFFAEVGLELDGEMSAEGRSVDRIVGLEDVRTDFAFMRTPDRKGALELIKFKSPAYDGDNDPSAPSHAPGIRHIAFAVDDIEATLARLQALGAERVGELVQYEQSYKLCYVRGPAGIIVELAEKVG